MHPSLPIIADATALSDPDAVAARDKTALEGRGRWSVSDAATRSVAGAPSGFASVADTMSADDDIDGQRLKCDFGRGRPILPTILVEAIRLRGGT
jgi:hypothetical protein